MFNMQEIKIKPASNGFIVEVGCKVFVVDSTKKLLKELERYIKDPNKVEKLYEIGAINKGSDTTCWLTPRLSGTSRRV